MPYMSEFYGIIIRMFFNDHNPPHFHARYQGKKGIFDFSGNMIRGSIKSKRTLSMIKEWGLLHTEELEQNWENINKTGVIEKIAPLD